MSSAIRSAKNIMTVQSKEISNIQNVKSVISSASANELVSGFPPIPDNDLLDHGGKKITDLKFINFYVGNSGSWNQNDIYSIDSALASAMSDKNLNNVILQYYPGHDSITTTFMGSKLISGNYPDRFFKDDVQNLVRDVHSQGKLDSLDLGNTVINFMLSRGKMLNTGIRADGILPQNDDSSSGLGGFHGSVHIPVSGNIPLTIYYAVGAYSEMLPNQQMNGIVAFDNSWKNIVATFYHELIEARTDTDVEDADQDKSVLGWYSDGAEIPPNSGNLVAGEIGDLPIDEANLFAARDLSTVFKEVPLTNGTGRVPVQLMYSNVVHGPEGPH
jgi:hypothetical protein